MRAYTVILIFFCLFANTVFVYSQSKYQQGFIVTNRNDTIYGQLRDRSEEPFGRIFKKVRKKSFWIFDKKYDPKDLKAYKIDSRIYESIWFDSYTNFLIVNYRSVPKMGRKVFMRLSVDGKVKLYWEEFRDPDSGYELEIPFFKKVNSSEMVRVTQGVFGLKRKRLMLFFEDCPDLVYKIQNRELNSPVEIANYYNNWHFEEI